MSETLDRLGGANRQTVGVKRCWQEIQEEHKLEITRPHAELGLAAASMGIGVFSERETFS